MARIIAGFAGSLSLTVPREGTRPTSDRVREAIFSALDARGALSEARVLDLYCGTGALGLEAASRGAATVTLVDSSNAAVKAARANATLVRARAPRDIRLTVDVVGQAVVSFLQSGAVQSNSAQSESPQSHSAQSPSTSTQWDLVFIDPPYNLLNDEISTVLGMLVNRLASDAVILLERSSRDAEPELPAGLTLERRRDYGDTSLYWILRTSAKSNGSAGVDADADA